MRKGFTLIELIFAIVIIGVLAAVAVPKFTNLKQNAEAAGAIKVAMDTFGSNPNAYVNLVDLEDNAPANVDISDLVSVSGKGWTLDDTAGTAVFKDGTATVVTITYNDTERNVTIAINCGNFTDTNTDKKCGKIVKGTETAGQTLNDVLTF